MPRTEQLRLYYLPASGDPPKRARKTDRQPAFRDARTGTLWAYDMGQSLSRAVETASAYPSICSPGTSRGNPA